MHFLAFTVAVLCTTGALCAPSDVSGCPRGSIYPHSTECNKYVTCDHGKTQERTCSAGLLFDPVVLVCNHAVNVQCRQVVEEKPKEPIEVKPKEPIEEKEIPNKKYCLSGRGQFPHPTDCNKYYNCWDGHIVITRCPAGTNFDASKHHCVESSLADCAAKRLQYVSVVQKPGTAKKPEESNEVHVLRPDKKPEESNEIPDIKYCSKARGQFPHPTDCKKYYDCWDTVVLIRDCPEGTLFDATRAHCGHPDDVTCHNGDQEIPDKKFCLSARGQFPHPTDCNKYYNCWDDHIVISSCPAGTGFHSKTNRCEASSLADCGVKRTPYHADVANSVISVPTEQKSDKNVNKKPEEIPNRKYCLKARGQFPHPTDCEKYYDCWDRTVLIQNCPVGTLFDAQKVRCASENSVKCKVHAPEETKPDIPVEKKPDEPKDIPNIKYCLKARGQFPHPTDCMKYYDCWDSVVLIQSCPEGTLFDAVKVHCGFEDSVTCNVHGHDAELEEQPTGEKEIPDHRFCLSARGQFPHPTDCRKYYNCWDGQIVITNCPAGTAFDAAKRFCEESALAACHIKRIQYKASNGFHQISLSLSLQKTVQYLDDFDDEKYIKGVRILDHKCPEARGQFGHESSCKMFYNCWDEVVLLQRCPNGLLFEPVKRICDSPDRVNCNGKFHPKIEDKNTDDSKSDFDDDKYIKGVRVFGHKCPEAKGQFGHESSCKMFYNCWDEVVLLQRCPNGHLFDPVKRICDSPDRVNCNGKFNPKLGVKIPSTSDYDDEKYIKGVPIFGHKCPEARGQFSHENSCKMFYNCWDEVVLLQRCPNSLLFDPVKRICDSPDRVNCNGKLDPKIDDKSNSKSDFDDDKYIKGVPIFGHKCPGARGQFGHESSCKMFYNCWDEVVLLQRCPNGLLFDPVKRICDSPDRVNCNGKFNPNIEEKKDTAKVKCNVVEGLMPNPQNCRTFYICVQGFGSEFTCPSNLLFDVTTMACGYPHEAKCAGSIHDGGHQQKEQPDSKIYLSTVGFKCEGKADGVYESNECHIFIKCVAGRSYQYVCPANLVYDTRTKRCDYAENVARSCNTKV